MLSRFQQHRGFFTLFILFYYFNHFLRLRLFIYIYKKHLIQLNSKWNLYSFIELTIQCKFHFEQAFLLFRRIMRNKWACFRKMREVSSYLRDYNGLTRKKNPKSLLWKRNYVSGWEVKNDFVPDFNYFLAPQSGRQTR